MDGGQPIPGMTGSLPFRIERLGATDAGWSAIAAQVRALGLGLIMRGVQRGQPVLVLAADPLQHMILCSGAMGAGAVPVAVDPCADAAATLDLAMQERCALLLIADAERQHALRAGAAALPGLHALVGPDGADWRHRPAMFALADVAALGRAVDALDPGMWGDCLGGLRPTDAALHLGDATMTHASCAAALATVPATPPDLAAALAALLDATAMEATA
jgi:acyl-CoA synthetase (AMP-forming)/AMP-acid ligase II